MTALLTVTSRSISLSCTLCAGNMPGFAYVSRRHLISLGMWALILTLLERVLLLRSLATDMSRQFSLASALDTLSTL